MLTCRAPRRRGHWRCGCRSRGWRHGASATTCRRTWGRSLRGAGRARSSCPASSGRRRRRRSSSSSAPPQPRPTGADDPVLRRGAGVPARWWPGGEEEARVSSSRGCEGREVLERDQKRCSRWDFVIGEFVDLFKLWSLGLYDPNLFLVSAILAFFRFCGSKCPTGCQGLTYV